MHSIPTRVVRLLDGREWELCATPRAYWELTQRTGQSLFAWFDATNALGWPPEAIWELVWAFSSSARTRYRFKGQYSDFLELVPLGLAHHQIRDDCMALFVESFPAREPEPGEENPTEPGAGPGGEA